MRARQAATVACAAAIAILAGAGAFRPRGSSVPAYEARKAEALLRRRLPCLGCHALEGRGGRIGPELTEVGARRGAEWIAAKIRDPTAAAPGTLMPPVAVPDAWVELVARYLAERGGRDGGGARSAAAPLRAGAAAGGGTAAEAGGGASPDGAALYARHCAACHGAAGGGDGWNAPHLPVRPTVHADAAAMAARPDDVLYDAIAAGGFIMGKSPYMPPFGGLLSPKEMRALVAHIRRLCGCRGPAWSRDGAG